MKITGVKTTTLSGYKDWNFVRVETDEGISGIGEAHPGEGMTEVIQKRLKPLILGKDPRNVEPLYNHMISRTVGQSVAGMVVGAIGGVETALWDITGKSAGVPAYQLLGGKYRDSIRLYADVGRGRNRTDTPEAWAARAKEGVADGFEAIKFDIDHSADELQHDIVNRGLSLGELDKITALVSAVRDAVGSGIDVCIDCHGIYAVRDVILLAKRLEPSRSVLGSGSIAGTDFAGLSRNRPVTCSTWTFRVQAACSRQKRSPTWRIFIICRLRRTILLHPWVWWQRVTSVQP